jgi:hypothetical protein
MSPSAVLSAQSGMAHSGEELAKRLRHMDHAGFPPVSGGCLPRRDCGRLAGGSGFLPYGQRALAAISSVKKFALSIGNGYYPPDKAMVARYLYTFSGVTGRVSQDLPLPGNSCHDRAKGLIAYRIDIIQSGSGSALTDG